MKRQCPRGVELTPEEQGWTGPGQPTGQALLLGAGALDFSQVHLSGPLGCISLQLSSSPAEANPGYFLEFRLGLSCKL